MDSEEANRRLFRAVNTGNFAEVRAALNRGANVNSRAAFEQTPLHSAASKFGYSDIVKLLIEKGADVNATAELQGTPLHWAIQAGDSDTVKVLIENGADIHARDEFGNPPRRLATAKHLHLSSIIDLLDNASTQQRGHTGRVTEERKGKGPPRVGG